MALLLACIPVGATRRDGSPYVPRPGSRKLNCPQCGRPMWMGPAQTTYFVRGTPAVCQPCALERSEGVLRVVSLVNRLCPERN